MWSEFLSTNLSIKINDKLILTSNRSPSKFFWSLAIATNTYHTQIQKAPINLTNCGIIKLQNNQLILSHHVARDELMPKLRMYNVKNMGNDEYISAVSKMKEEIRRFLEVEQVIES